MIYILLLSVFFLKEPNEDYWDYIGSDKDPNTDVYIYGYGIYKGIKYDFITTHFNLYYQLRNGNHIESDEFRNFIKNLYINNNGHLKEYMSLDRKYFYRFRRNKKLDEQYNRIYLMGKKHFINYFFNKSKYKAVYRSKRLFSDQELVYIVKYAIKLSLAISRDEYSGTFFVCVDVDNFEWKME